METHRVKKSLTVLAVVAAFLVASLVYAAWRLTRPAPICFAKVTSIADVPDIPTQLLGIPFESDILSAQQSGWGDRYAKTWLFGRLSHPIGHIDGQPDDSYRETIKKGGRYDKEMEDIVRAGSREYNVPTIGYGRECIVRVFTFKHQHYCEVYYDEGTGRVFAWITVSRWLRREPGELTVGKPGLFKRSPKVER